MLLPGTCLLNKQELSTFVELLSAFPRFQNIIPCGNHDIYLTVHSMNKLLLTYFHGFFKLGVLSDAAVWRGVPWKVVSRDLCG